MVFLVVKKGDESQFLYQTPIHTPVEDAINNCVEIYNGRLKISRVCYEMEELAKHGTLLPPEILEILPEQAEELGLKDIWAERCAPHGWINNKDPIGRRCGRQPSANLQKVLKDAAETAKQIISKQHCAAGIALCKQDVSRALAELKGAVSIVYPMGLPPHDTIRQELENREELQGTQASLEVLDPATTVMWFCGKQLLPGAALTKQLGTNDKCKVKSADYQQLMALIILHAR